MFEHLMPRNGPVFDGFEEKEVVYAADQPEYNPLRTIVSRDHQHRVTSRWTFTDDQRQAIAGGADIFLTLLTFGEPLQPILMAVSDGKLDLNWVKDCFLCEPASAAKAAKTDHGNMLKSFVDRKAN
jgi:hypothetical protein